MMLCLLLLFYERYVFFFRNQSVTNLKPINIGKDGSCLFKSVCWSLFGSEAKAHELRVRTCVFMHNNAGLFNIKTLRKIFRENLSKKDMAIILDSSVDESSFVKGDQKSTIKNHSRSLLASSKWGSMIDILFISQMLNIEIDVVYPCKDNKFTRQELFSGTIKPSDAPNHKIFISWTSTDHSSIQQLASGRWRPNHFVPCVPITEPVTDTLVSLFFVFFGKKFSMLQN